MFELLFHRHPLERVWTRFQKYERALSPINNMESRLAKRSAVALRNSLQREIDRRRSRGTCSVEGVRQIVDRRVQLPAPSSQLPSPGFASTPSAVLLTVKLAARATLG